MTKQGPVREFRITDGKREAVPLILGLFSPSGGGKTYTALRLATGIQRIVGGDIGFLDTESRRALAYADMFKFRHVDFKAPFRSTHYLEGARALVAAGCKTVIIDSMSHEHEGPGGMVDYQEEELDRMAGDDYGKRERMKMLAWAKPKAARRALLNGLLQLDANFILCFRAKQTAKPVKVGNKTEVVQLGFMPIAGDEFVFECTLAALFLPGAAGVPTWESENVGERMMIKVPEQFRSLKSGPPVVMDEALGERLAKWAQGGEKRAPEPSSPPASPPPPPPPSPPAAPPPPPAEPEQAADDGFPGDQAPPETQGGLALEDPAGEPAQAQEEAQEPATGFVAYVDAIAAARSWAEIKAALTALTSSEEWKAAESTMRNRSRAISHTRLMELVDSGAFKLDFIDDAQAFRNYIEAETSADALTGNRRAFEAGDAFKRLPEASQTVIGREADRRFLELTQHAGGDAEQFT